MTKCMSVFFNSLSRKPEKRSKLSSNTLKLPESKPNTLKAKERHLAVSKAGKKGDNSCALVPGSAAATCAPAKFPVESSEAVSCLLFRLRVSFAAVAGKDSVAGLYLSCHCRAKLLSCVKPHQSESASSSPNGHNQGKRSMLSPSLEGGSSEYNTTN